VIFHYTTNEEKTKENLDLTYHVCSSFTNRRTIWNLNQAITVLEQDEQNAIREEETRREQRKLAMRCVNPDLISKLQNALDIRSITAECCIVESTCAFASSLKQFDLG